MDQSPDFTTGAVVTEHAVSCRSTEFADTIDACLVRDVSMTVRELPVSTRKGPDASLLRVMEG